MSRFRSMYGHMTSRVLRTYSTVDTLQTDLEWYLVNAVPSHSLKDMEYLLNSHHTTRRNFGRLLSRRNLGYNRTA
jgi:hypothetical protein